MTHSATAAILMLSTLAACSSAADKVVPDPTGITLEAGLVQVVRGLRAAEAESRRTGQQSLGLDPCTVTVTFNVTADGKSRDQIVLDASVKPTIGPVAAGLGLQATSENTLTATRGNQISVLLTSAACNPANTLGTLHPGNLVTLAEQSAEIRRRRLSILRRNLTPEQRERLEPMLRQLERE